MIDMHGDRNKWYGEHNWQCGIAGETMMIERNTILYTNGNAIKIRGNLADKAVADGNVFKNSRDGSFAFHDRSDRRLRPHQERRDKPDPDLGYQRVQPGSDTTAYKL